jgi:hypothetical protein
MSLGKFIKSIIVAIFVTLNVVRFRPIFKPMLKNFLQP